MFTAPANIVNDEMNAPFFVSSATTTDGSSTTNHIINLPSGTQTGAQSASVCILCPDIVAILGSLNTSVSTTPPASWGTTATVNTTYFAKILDGTDGSTITVTTASAVLMNSLAIATRNDLITPPSLISASATSTSPQPSLLTSTTTPQQAVGLAWVIYGSGATVSVYPYPNHHILLARGSTLFDIGFCMSDPFWFANTYQQPAWTLTGSVVWEALLSRRRTTW